MRILFCCLPGILLFRCGRCTWVLLNMSREVVVFMTTAASATTMEATSDLFFLGCDVSNSTSRQSSLLTVANLVELVRALLDTDSRSGISLASTIAQQATKDRFGAVKILGYAHTSNEMSRSEYRISGLLDAGAARWNSLSSSLCQQA